MRPRSLRIEASSACQLRCPACPTATGAAHATLGRGHLRAEDFARLLDDNPRVRAVELSNYGEMLLNPELPALLAHADRRGVQVTADNGVNLCTARPETLEAMVVHRLRSLTVSIDGATQETYARYRVGGELKDVLANVRTLNRLKQEHGSRYPRLRWQMVVLGHAEHEITAARRLAQELGMEFCLKLAWDDEHAPVRDPELVRRETGLGVATRAEYRERHGVDYMRAICHQLWKDPQLNWDGRMLGCCRNHWGDFGANAFTDGLAAATDSERMRHARAMLTGKAEPRDDVPCTQCDLYHLMRDTGRWISRTELALPHHAGRRLARIPRIRGFLSRVLRLLSRAK